MINLRRVAAAAPVPRLAEAIAVLDEAKDLCPPARPDVLLHGDLHLRHVLVADDGRCAGVIDWGDLCLGDVAIDLAIGYAAFAPSDRAAFVDAYTAGTGWDTDVALRARALALRMTCFLALHAHDIGDATMLAEALAGLDRAVR